MNEKRTWRVDPARFRNRDDWPAGQWDNEPDRIKWEDDQSGLPCLILRGPMGALCGYVGVPAGHPWHGRDYRWYDDDGNEIDNPVAQIEVHGGVTYAMPCDGDPENGVCHVAEPGADDDVWWVGFDTAHGNDYVPGLVAVDAKIGMPWPSPWVDGVYRDVAYVREQVESMVEQAVIVGVEAGL